MTQASRSLHPTLLPPELIEGMVQGIGYLQNVCPHHAPSECMARIFARFGSAGIDVVHALLDACLLDEHKFSYQEDAIAIVNFFYEDEVLRHVFLKKGKPNKQALTAVRRDMLYCTSEEELRRRYPEIEQLRPKLLCYVAMFNRLTMKEQIDNYFATIEPVIRASACPQRIADIKQYFFEFFLRITQVLPRDDEQFHQQLQAIRSFSLVAQSPNAALN